MRLTEGVNGSVGHGPRGSSNEPAEGGLHTGKVSPFVLGLEVVERLFKLGVCKEVHWMMCR